MFFHTVLSYAAYAAVTGITPGPNNILVLHAFSLQGWRKGFQVLAGVTCGFLCVMALCALFCYELDKYLPTATAVLKYVGAAYILWLALHVARSKPAQDETKQSTFLTGFLLQFLNVKIILYAITIYTGYVLPAGADLGVLLVHAVALMLFGLFGCSLWGLAGGLLQTFLSKHYKPFNYTMALILVICAIGML